MCFLAKCRFSSENIAGGGRLGALIFFGFRVVIIGASVFSVTFLGAPNSFSSRNAMKNDEKTFGTLFLYQFSLNTNYKTDLETKKREPPDAN